jgi:hypothetical protein
MQVSDNTEESRDMNSHLNNTGVYGNKQKDPNLTNECEFTTIESLSTAN